ncbi:tyrosine-protein phosphatase [Mariniflexile ostreae]|uniref:protein-tyrosine-phosphatase n=1 Tax=Mariniflexile ostreae TaxID=1520892 RepID=A0ABV5FAD9_9FLAO
MLSIFKKKPLLASLIPNTFCDIHSHCLPQIDDGAQDINESKTLLLGMQKLGFSKIITTPHTFPGLWDNTPATITGAYTALYGQEPELCNLVELGFASEYLISKPLIKSAEENTLLCIKDRFVLVEMSYLNPPLGLFDILFQLKALGYFPILAHPERYFFYHDTWRVYEKLKEAGCYFQLNLLSVVGYYGTSVTKIADKLLAHNMIDFVGSDIHHKRHVDAFYRKIKIKSQTALEKAIHANQVFV